AHATEFPDGTKERLHGHNFQVTVALDLRSTDRKRLVDLGLLKSALTDLCAAWNERVLLAARSPELRILKQDDRELEINLCGRRYVFPADEVILLPVTNVVVETLAEVVAHTLLERLTPSVPGGEVTGLEVTITESDGQGGSYALMLDG